MEKDLSISRTSEALAAVGTFHDTRRRWTREEEQTLDAQRNREGSVFPSILELLCIAHRVRSRLPH
jgi:hypothetical protein